MLPHRQPLLFQVNPGSYCGRCRRGSRRLRGQGRVIHASPPTAAADSASHPTRLDPGSGLGGAPDLVVRVAHGCSRRLPLKELSLGHLPLRLRRPLDLHGHFHGRWRRAGRRRASSTSTSSTSLPLLLLLLGLGLRLGLVGRGGWPKPGFALGVKLTRGPAVRREAVGWDLGLLWSLELLLLLLHLLGHLLLL